MEPPAPPEAGAEEPKYAGFTRFEMELEVSALLPCRLSHLLVDH